MFGGVGVNLMGGKTLLLPVGGLLLLSLLLIVGTSYGRRRFVQGDATSAGMYGVVGRFGSGKSYFLTYNASLAIAAGRRVFANYEIVGATLIRPFDVDDAVLLPRDFVGSYEDAEALGVAGWDLITLVPNDSMVIIDEAHLWWPSDAWRVPIRHKKWVSTLRHRGITFFWGSQIFEAVAKWLFKLSFGIWECERFKKGHRYTRYDPRRIGGRVGSREFESRIVLVRSKEIQGMYDTFNVASDSVEWGGDVASGPTRAAN
jgi:hypothetical protein